MSEMTLLEKEEDIEKATKANMAKLPGKTKRHYQDAIKPKGWVRPDIQKVINDFNLLLDKQEKERTNFLKGG